MVVLFSFFIKKRKNFKRTLFATLLGFSGICLMLLSEENISVSLSSQQSLGYGLAFLCAIVWSLYTVISKTFQCPSEIVGFYGFVGAIFCAVLHFTLEETIMPNLLEWIVLFTMGIGITGFAYYCWDKGIKKGNFQLLSILSYINPILSITWLAIFGLGEVRLIILLSACMIIIGAFGGGITPKQWRFFRQGIQHLRVLLKLKDRRTTLAIIRQHKVHHADFDARKNKSISSFNLIKLKK
jgi:drug/metabolite transporter (DMT)-like permease